MSSRVAVQSQQRQQRRSQAGYELDRMTRNLLASSKGGIASPVASNLVDEGVRRAQQQEGSAARPAHEGLLDIFNPDHNARELAKELVLLEGHIVHPPKHCPDCIRKHLITAEGLAEEAVSLDPDPESRAYFGAAATELREICRDFLNQSDRGQLQQRIRRLRKGMLKRGFDSVLRKEKPGTAAPKANPSSAPAKLGQDKAPSPISSVFLGIVPGARVAMPTEGGWRMAVVDRVQSVEGRDSVRLQPVMGNQASIRQTMQLQDLSGGDRIIVLAPWPISTSLSKKTFQRFRHDGSRVGSPVSLSDQQLLMADIIQSVWMKVLGSGKDLCAGVANISNPAQLDQVGCSQRVIEQLVRAAIVTALYESNLNPLARRTTSTEDSIGLFQLNRKGGIGQGSAPGLLMDPGWNATVAANAVRKHIGLFRTLIAREGAMQPTRWASGWTCSRGVCGVRRTQFWRPAPERTPQTSPGPRRPRPRSLPRSSWTPAGTLMAHAR